MDIERQQEIVKINNLFFLKCFYICDISWDMTLNCRPAVRLKKLRFLLFAFTVFFLFFFLNIEHLVEENHRGKDTSISKK